MKKKVFVLIFLAVCLCSSAFGIPSDMLNNSDYEEPVFEKKIKEINLKNITGYDSLEKEETKNATGLAMFYENALKTEKIEKSIKIGIFIIMGIIILIFINSKLKKMIRKRRSLKQHEKQLEKINNQFDLENK